MGDLAWLLLVPAAAVAALGGGLALVERRYRVPRVPHRRTPADAGLRFEELRFPTAGDATLYGWWIPAAPGAPTAILVHGWGRNAARTLGLARRLHAGGYAALAFDLRCHGRSGGEEPATMVKFSEDIRAAVDEAVRRGAVPGRVAVVGLSVGGSAAIHAAARDPRIGAVVTVGAFAHPGDAMAHEMRSRGLPRAAVGAVLRWVERRVGFRLDDVAPERQVARVACPVLVVHGVDDRTVPAEHGRRIAAAGGGPRPAARAPRARPLRLRSRPALLAGGARLPATGARRRLSPRPSATRPPRRRGRDPRATVPPGAAGASGRESGAARIW